jgi:hypothetical protein
MINKYDVMLILEGTYPFNGGGVSTWAHMLCCSVKNVNYTLYSINADFEEKSKYQLSDNRIGLPNYDTNKRKQTAILE